jgi:photosystem II stability/assembly factor-like uncharacterized protein
VYYGCQVIFATSNGGQTWKTISPDLSTQDKSKILFSGGIIGDNLGQFYGEVVFAIAPSEIQRGLIWAGTNDGQVWYTRDGGGRWTNVTKNISGLPPWGTIRKIEPSHFDPGTAYVVVDLHLVDNRDPFIYKTTDFGQTWKKVSDALPAKHPLAYALSVAENPNRRGMLFAGTGHGFYYSLNDGGSWTQIKDGLPAGAGHLDRHPQALARHRRIDLRPRAVHPERHHDAGAVGQSADGDGRVRLRTRGRRSVSRGPAARRLCIG